MKLLIAAFFVAAPTTVAAAPLDLICYGKARSLEATQTFGSAYSGGESASGSATSYRRVQSDETLRIHIDDGGIAGKVKLPRTLVPPISVGKEGWWDFVKLEVGDDTIRGQISLNLVNRPKVVIDRHTGDVEMKGFGGGFSGTCERSPDAPEERKF